MNKKGFTLAELLGVIVIIGLLLLLIIPLIINGVKSRENKVEETQNNIIFEAVGEYLDLDKDKYPNIPGSVYCVSIKELKDTGILVDPVKKIVEDGNYDDNYTIEVIITKEGTRKYSVSEGECKPYKSKNIEIVISPSNSKWSREKEVTIYYPETCGGEYTCTYKKDNGGVVTVPNGNRVKIKFDKDGIIEATIKGQSEVEKKEKVEKIDIVNPVILKIQEGNWNDHAQALITLTLTDAHSGVGGYCIKTTPEKPEADDPCFKTVRFPAYGGVGTVSEYLSQGTYYFFVKDRVGNVSNYLNSDSGGKPKTWWKVEDKTPPTCTIITSGAKIITSSEWYTGDVTVKMNIKDDHSGIFHYDLTTSNTPSYSKYCGKTSSDCGTDSKQKKDYNYSIIHKTDTTGTPYYGYVKDRAHNINKCNLATQVRKDTVKPTCSLGESGATKVNGWYPSGNPNVFISAKSDATPGSGISAYGVGTSTVYDNQISKSQTLDTTGTTYYGYIKDVAGWTNTCSNTITIKRDTVAPTCSTSKSHTGTTDGVTVSISCNDSSPSSGVTCPSQKTGVKSSQTYTVRDNAGHSNTCSVGVSETKQWYRQTCSAYVYKSSSACGAATCTSSCCGYNQGACNQWCCEEAGSGVIKCGSSPSICGSSSENDGGAYCVGYGQGAPKTCTSSSCCGYKSCRDSSHGCDSWKNAGWYNSSCSSVDCRATDTRYLYS